jgi:hypothetical protein
LENWKLRWPAVRQDKQDRGAAEEGKGPEFTGIAPFLLSGMVDFSGRAEREPTTQTGMLGPSIAGRIHPVKHLIE